ncbi:unnamed protein product [Penicillium roqueforti FM164]|uniref:Genomic scaffold, ProqFM164S01 n=1 Tax=Penicillium roqueforti (strain FM164) TaxID=1365484 RepID=W6PXI2_PENRF|nr:unnamed protein product [Penicillium roqueforti FM164]
MGATSLSVIARKAAERVVASSFVFQGRILANVSVCERAEGSRACGGSIGWQLWWLMGIAIDRTSLSTESSRASRSNVSVCEHAEGNRTYGGFVFFLPREGFGDISVCERAEGSRACGGFVVFLQGVDTGERLCL